MKFHNNTFGKIEPGGLTIRSNHFEFTRNQVEEINFKGLDVLGFKIQIGENKILNLNTRAFENVGFSYLPDKFEKASRFSYNFSGNSIENLDPGSLHPDWSDLFNTCSEVIFENNQFDCSCMNLGWTKSFSGLGRKISTFKQFYDLYLSSENNYCSGYNCSLTYVLNNMVDICSEKVSVSSICKPQEI